MIHLWTLEDNNLELNVTELLKYKLLAEIYNKDTSKEKYDSKEYFKYLDFMTNSKGYCVTKGLNFNESDSYSRRQCLFSKSFKFPENNKTIVEYVRDNLEYDPIDESLRACIKTLRISSKTLTSYIDLFNEQYDTNFTDKDGNIVDVTATINRAMKVISEIPATITKYQELIEKQKNNSPKLRGDKEYEESMDGDASLEQFIPDEE